MRFLLVIVLLVPLGCGAQAYKPDRGAATSMESTADMEPAMAVDSSGSGGEGDAAEPMPSENALRRKIIYTAEVDLVVEGFAEVPKQVEQLAKEYGGYVANSEVSGSPGSRRRGRWTIRVPVERYPEFLDAAQGLGEVRRVSSNSRDVSEEYYDVEARIRNKRRTEERLLAQLEDPAGKLRDILEIERELDRVREKIEQMEGRMRVLTDLTSLTTVTISVEEIKRYVSEEAPAYSTRLGRSWHNSIDTLKSAAENSSIAVIAALPWVGLLLVPVIALWLLVRILRKRRR